MYTQQGHAFLLAALFSAPVWPAHTGRQVWPGPEAVSNRSRVQTLTTVHNVFQAERKAYILNGIYSIY